MSFLSRLRRPGTRKAGAVALTVAAAALFAACGGNHPDSIFHQRTDFNRDVDYLFRILIIAGTAVFIFVEGILIWTLIRFRARPGQPEPEHVHGNTTLEIAWTVIPLLILIVIGVPTVQTVVKTQAAARSDALQVEVIGHQWWWEFRYPGYRANNGGKVDTLVTANELYLPLGKTVNFTLKTRDVIHSFWVPALAGKRDLIANHTNYLWFTPDSAGEGAWNGACVEFCGASHANMRFKTFTVSQADFDSWAAHGLTPATSVVAAAGAPAPGAPGATGVASPQPTTGAVQPGRTQTQPASPAANQPGAGVPASPAPQTTQVQQAGFTSFPRDRLPAYVIPQTPIPANVTFDDNLLASGNAASGEQMVTKGMCAACHTIRGTVTMAGVLGPNLTHLGTRTTIAGAIYPNDPRHLARWIKNPSKMKPGVIMNSFGIGEYDPQTKAILKAPMGFTDQQIADIVAYLGTLK
jgi:cytochrome c oxidase subunit II